MGRRAGYSTFLMMRLGTLYEGDLLRLLILFFGGLPDDPLILRGRSDLEVGILVFFFSVVERCAVSLSPDHLGPWVELKRDCLRAFVG